MNITECKIPKHESTSGKLPLKFPSLAQREQRERATPLIFKLTKKFPKDIFLSDAWNWFDDQMDPQNKSLRKEEIDEAKQREELYIEAGFPWVEGKGLFNDWSSKPLDFEEIKIDKEADTEQEYLWMRSNKKGYYIVRLRSTNIEGETILREFLYKGIK